MGGAVRSNLVWVHSAKALAVASAGFGWGAGVRVGSKPEGNSARLQALVKISTTLKYWQRFLNFCHRIASPHFFAIFNFIHCMPEKMYHLNNSG
jgi:hypothetical protein